ncbi:hypothetical protein ACLOJK_020276 [Asimina triloba]
MFDFRRAEAIALCSGIIDPKHLHSVANLHNTNRKHPITKVEAEIGKCGEFRSPGPKLRPGDAGNSPSGVGCLGWRQCRRDGPSGVELDKRMRSSSCRNPREEIGRRHDEQMQERFELEDDLSSGALEGFSHHRAGLGSPESLNLQPAALIFRKKEVNEDSVKCEKVVEFIVERGTEAVGRCKRACRGLQAAITMQASRARLFKEYKEVQREKAVDSDIQLVCDDSNIFKWTALIKGPSETPYEGGVFQLAFAIPEQYPLLPPQVRFQTKIFHPNVHFKTGEICLDILKNAWSPAWTLQSVCRAIIALMAHPEPDSPLNCDSGIA